MTISHATTAGITTVGFVPFKTTNANTTSSTSGLETTSSTLSNSGMSTITIAEQTTTRYSGVPTSAMHIHTVLPTTLANILYSSTAPPTTSANILYNSTVLPITLANITTGFDPFMTDSSPSSGSLSLTSESTTLTSTLSTVTTASTTTNPGGLSHILTTRSSYLF